MGSELDVQESEEEDNGWSNATELSVVRTWTSPTIGVRTNGRSL